MELVFDEANATEALNDRRTLRPEVRSAVLDGVEAVRIDDLTRLEAPSIAKRSSPCSPH